MSDIMHWSDCAMCNSPAYPPEKCDCGAVMHDFSDESIRRLATHFKLGETIEFANALLAAHESQSLPEGWKLVPIQATEAIQDAVNRAIRTPDATNSDVWRAGVDAA